jgi:hypothetical protein
MTSDEPRRIFVGVLPSGHDAVFVDGPDPVSAMVREAAARLDAERAAEAKALAVRAADLARLQNTARARLARRFRRVLAAALPRMRK